MAGTALKRDEALLWLNDRLGRHVTLCVIADGNDVSSTPLSTRGVLQHWTATLGDARMIGESGAAVGQRLAGVYLVGGCELDVESGMDDGDFRLARRTISGVSTEELVLDIGPNVRVVVTDSDAALREDDERGEDA